MKCIRICKEKASLVLGEDIGMDDILFLMESLLIGGFMGKKIAYDSLFLWIEKASLGFLGTILSFTF
jgi:hypothetical protein